MTNVNEFSYSSNPIGSIEALARTLNEPVPRLLRIAQRASRLYIGPKLEPKPDGTFRETFDAKRPLKVVHEAILVQILSKIVFPYWVMGGVKDPDGTRGYIRSAQIHAGAKLLIGGDIKNFFPSVPVGRIRAMFMHVCRFPPDVAGVLAQLCTKDGVLVQGSKTSTALANLALYREEPAMVERVRALGFEYGRFIDDMNCSTRRFVTAEVRTSVVQEIRGTIEKVGLRPKREKQFIVSAGSRMRIHKLNVNAKASKPAEYRSKLRSDIHRLQVAADNEIFSPEFESALKSAATRVGGLKLLNPEFAKRMKKQLALLKATYRGFQDARTASSLIVGQSSPRSARDEAGVPPWV